MSIGAIGSNPAAANGLIARFIGSGAVTPHRASELVGRIDPGRDPERLNPTFVIDPVVPGRPGGFGPLAPGRPQENEEGRRAGTVVQRNSDGDEAVLGSRADDLSDEERREVERLQQRDREVRQHEEAHVAAAGSLHRSGPHYDYITGPDGQRYAVGGRVEIDTSEGRTPEETLTKAQQMRRAALAPADPSSADRAVAAKAMEMESRARIELTEQRAAKFQDESGEASAPTAGQAAAPVGSLEAATRRLDLFA
ncbi:MAG: hypothetical protein EA376_09815 [Phycisphaeraceae bacterium]|nr:MAG: hypothetical protein EA376_09815 [Phycisphaeraceae bacterium]